MIQELIRNLFNLPNIVYKGIAFFLILVFTWIIAKIVKRAVNRALRFSLPQFSSQAEQLAYFFVWFLGILLAVNQIGFSLDALLLFIGLLGVLLIISLKDAFSNIFSKPFLDLFYRCGIGEEITLGKYKGKVIEKNPLNTIVLDKKGNLIVIPNSLFFKEVSVIKSPHRKLFVSLPIVFNAKLREEKVEREVLKLCRKMKREIRFDKPPILIPGRMRGSNKFMTLIFYVRDPERKSYVSLKMNESIRKLIQRLEKRVK